MKLTKYLAQKFHEKNEKVVIIILVLFTLLIVSLGFAIYLTINYKLKMDAFRAESENLQSELSEINQKYAETISLLDTSNRDKQTVVDSLNQIGIDYNNLMQKYSGSIDQINTLKRTEEIDDELLKKYSKYYFLNENYSPKVLTPLGADFVEPGKNISLVPEVKFRLENMILNAKNSGVKILVNSGYRSFEEQKGLKSRYSLVYGLTKANQFSADQGYSEHQLGTTVDLSDGVKVLDQSFENTESFKWLQNNAYLYGFALSYPKGNKYYIYEPWHYRFVGLELAKYLHDNNKNFYNLDQNFIDTYKSKIFN
jgi:LAS superfamily LD-carboxypeptidase LdcB